ncbi:MAG: PHB depolymerase family esterase [Deltaproteobacteria bacterium]|nr:PHB depolymerase family esterase [Deltaproteobacteria bacterium]
MSPLRIAGLVAAAMSISSSAHAAWETKQLAGMSVEVYTPAGMSPIGSGRALMIALHGCAQTGSQLQQYGNFESAAEDFGMVVALPTVPGGGVIAGCWNYYGATHTRTSGHNKPIIELAQSLRDDAGYGVDPAQIYLVGFSSGGGQALIVGCLAPEIFAGVGVSAGPSLGTSVSQIAQVGTNVGQTVTLCQQYAGANAASFDTQLAITFTDSNDFTVAQGYAQINAEMYATIYGGGTLLGSAPFDVASLPGTNPAGSALAYDDAEGERVASISSMGVGHNWPSGSGTAGPPTSYVAGTGLNLSYFAAETFTANARRADGEWNPGGEDSGSDGGSDAGSGSEGGESGSEAGEAGGGSNDDAAGTDGGSTGGGAGGEGGSGISTATAGADGGYVPPSGCQCSSIGDTQGAAVPWFAAACVALRLRRRRAV